MFIFITLVLTNLSSNKAEQKKFLLHEERQQCLNHDRWLSTKNSLRCCFLLVFRGLLFYFVVSKTKKKERRWKENKQIITSSYADYLVSFCTQLLLVVFACMLHPIACKCSILHCRGLGWNYWRVYSEYIQISEGCWFRGSFII